MAHGRNSYCLKAPLGLSNINSRNVSSRLYTESDVFPRGPLILCIHKTEASPAQTRTGARVSYSGQATPSQRGGGQAAERGGKGSPRRGQDLRNL